MPMTDSEFQVLAKSNCVLCVMRIKMMIECCAMDVCRSTSKQNIEEGHENAFLNVKSINRL